MQVETVLQMINEEDLLDIDLAKKVAGRVFSTGDPEIISYYLRKLEFAFLRQDNFYRMDLINHMILEIRSSSEEDIMKFCKDSIAGNVLAVCMFLEDYELIDIQKLEIPQKLSSLEFLRNDDFAYFVPSNKRFKIALLETRDKEMPESLIVEITDVIEALIISGLAEQSEMTIEGILRLYGNSKKFSKKKLVLKFLLNGNYSHFLAAVRDIGGDFNDMIENYREIYYFLLEKKVPLFFDYMNIEFSDIFSNKNSYPVLYQDINGQNKLLDAFSNLSIENTGNFTQIYDINSDSWIFPRKNLYKRSPEEIFSFHRMVYMKNPEEEDISKVKNLKEDEIIEFIGTILQDPNRVSHDSTERADIFTVKLLLDNENDCRNAAFVLKGKSFRRIHLKDVAHQIYKACGLSVGVVVLVFTGNIDDDSRNCLIDTCESKRKIWCLIDSIDLTRILKAYSMI